MSSAAVGSEKSLQADPYYPLKGGARIPSLDGLRAIAVLLVVLSHLAGGYYYVPHVIAGQFPWRFMTLGRLGVHIFFVISGFLITTLLLHEHQRSGSISLRSFYIRRAYRILPASYALVLTVALLVATGVLMIPLQSFLAAIFYVMNYWQGFWYLEHLWSLAVEEQFYFLWPLALKLCGPRRATIIALASLPVATLFRTLRPLTQLGFESNMDALACGCILAATWGWLGRHERWQKFLQSRMFWCIPLVVVALSKLRLVGGPWEAVGITISNILIAISLERFVRYNRTSAARFLNLRFPVLIGTISYSLYLWQQLWVHQGHADSVWQTFPLNVALAFCCAALSYYLIEQPFLRLRDRRRRLIG